MVKVRTFCQKTAKAELEALGLPSATNKCVAAVNKDTGMQSLIAAASTPANALQQVRGGGNSILRYFDDNDKAQQQFTGSKTFRLDPARLSLDDLNKLKKPVDAASYLSWANVNKIGDTKSSDQRSVGDIATDLFSGFNKAIGKETDDKRKGEYTRDQSIVAGVFQGNSRFLFDLGFAFAQTMRLSPSSLNQLKSGNPIADASFNNDFKPVRMTAILGEKVFSGLIPSLGFEGRLDNWRWSAFSLFVGARVSFAEYASHRDEFQRTNYSTTWEVAPTAHLTGLYDIHSGGAGVIRAGARVFGGALLRYGDGKDLFSPGNAYNGMDLGYEHKMDGTTYDAKTPFVGGEALVEYQAWKNFALGAKLGFASTLEQEKQVKMSQGTNVEGQQSVGIQGTIEDENIRNRPTFGLYGTFSW